jgi:hypothetical protein
MEYLATAGFDVFAMDVTGYGLSPRPMMDDTCNNATSYEQSYLIPSLSCSRVHALVPILLSFLGGLVFSVARVLFQAVKIAAIVACVVALIAGVVYAVIPLSGA